MCLLKARDQLRNGFQFRLGDERTSLWYADWGGRGAVANGILYVDIHDTVVALRDIIVARRWCFEDLYTVLPEWCIQQLQNVNPLLIQNGEMCGYGKEMTWGVTLLEMRIYGFKTLINRPWLL